MRKQIQIDNDLLITTRQYIEDQLATMAKFGEAPVLSAERYNRLVYDIARHPQEIRNWQKQDASADPEAAI